MRSFRRWRLVFTLLVSPLLAALFAVAATAQQPPAPATPPPAAAPAKPPAKPKPAPKPAPKPCRLPASRGQRAPWPPRAACSPNCSASMATGAPMRRRRRARRSALRFPSRRLRKPIRRTGRVTPPICSFRPARPTKWPMRFPSSSATPSSRFRGQRAMSARRRLRCTPSRTAPGSRMPPRKPIWSKPCGRVRRVVIKGGSAKGTQSTDTFALKGLSQALDRVGQECK